MPPEPLLAGVAASPAPGPLERLLRFGHLVFLSLAVAATGFVAAAVP